MDELQSLRTVDPVRNDRLLRKCASPLFEELFVQLISVEVDDGRLSPGPRNRSEPDRTPSSYRRRRLVFGGAVLAVAAVAVLFAVVLPTVNRAAQAPRWALVGDVSPLWQETLSQGLSPSLSLTCPSSTTCYASALGPGGVEVTRDGGKTWAAMAGAPTSLSLELSSVTCVSVSTCAAVWASPSHGPLFMETADAGRTWETRRAPSWIGSIYQAIAGGFQIDGVVSLSCSTEATCSVVATDGSSGTVRAFVTGNGGRAWSASTLPAGASGAALQCFPSGHCILAGRSGAAYSTDGGWTWSSAAVYPGFVGPAALLSCGNASDCMVMGLPNPTGARASWLGVTTDGGRHWSIAKGQGLPAAAAAPSLSCPTSSDCWASAGGPRGPFNIPPSSWPGAVIVSTTNAGATWQPDALPRGVGNVERVSCPGSNTCFALAWSQGSIVLLAHQG
jgi:hypothetical protein